MRVVGLLVGMLMLTCAAGIAQTDKNAPSLSQDSNKLCEAAWWESGPVVLKLPDREKKVFLWMQFKPDAAAHAKGTAKVGRRDPRGPENTSESLILKGPGDYELTERDGQRRIVVSVGKERLELPYRFEGEKLTITKGTAVNWPQVGKIELPITFTPTFRK